ncbi:hypothetical protein IPC331_34535 [Pseudomonas aeruginosa]|nr:hypothetical protein IPC331_34535 [Pseudomonas aeruginosa]HBP5662169.1 hypothetical protein [Pseudomonas aeruginosa]
MHRFDRAWRANRGISVRPPMRFGRIAPTPCVRLPGS